MKLIILNFVNPIQLVDTIVHPYVFHLSLYKFTKPSISLYSMSKYLFLISYGDGDSIPVATIHSKEYLKHVKIFYTYLKNIKIY